MKYLQWIKYLSLVLILTSCSQTKKEILWVSGIATDCTKNDVKKQCFRISKSKDLYNAKWENYYLAIDGFNFEKGFIKKIEVKSENIKNSSTLGYSTKYTFVNELEHLRDYRALLDGQWLLHKLNDKLLDENSVHPKLQLLVDQMKISGHGGCNNYFGNIETITFNTLGVSQISNTKKHCLTSNIEDVYLNTLNTINTYQIKGPNLILYNTQGKKVLSFRKE